MPRPGISSRMGCGRAVCRRSGAAENRILAGDQSAHSTRYRANAQVWRLRIPPRAVSAHLGESTGDRFGIHTRALSAGLPRRSTYRRILSLDRVFTLGRCSRSPSISSPIGYYHRPGADVFRASTIPKFHPAQLWSCMESGDGPRDQTSWTTTTAIDVTLVARTLEGDSAAPPRPAPPSNVFYRRLSAFTRRRANCFRTR